MHYIYTISSIKYHNKTIRAPYDAWLCL